RFLCNVFRLGCIVHVTHDQLQHLVLVSQDQQIERCALTPLDSLHQFEVTVLNTHSRTQTGELTAQPVAIDRRAGEKFDNSLASSTASVTLRTAVDSSSRAQRLWRSSNGCRVICSMREDSRAVGGRSPPKQ